MSGDAERSGKVLVLGIGNEILTDDGIGLKLLEDLQKKGIPANADYLRATVGGLEILELISGYRHAVFLDAIRTPDGTPGDVYIMDLSDFSETLHLSNLHDISFIQAIRLGEKLGYELPGLMHILAVEIVEDRVFSRKFTQEIEDRYPEILENVEKFFRETVS